MDNILISIIVPVFQVEEYVGACIESIQNQTYQNIEIILVDDGSKDQSLDVCFRYAKNDQRIIVLHQVNHGLSSSRNAGLRIATGEFIGFIDSDDTIEPQMFEEMLNKILENKSQMCVCTKYLIDNQSFYSAKIEKTMLYQKEAIKEMLHMNFPTSVCSCLYKKNILRDIYFDEEIYYWEDIEFQARIINQLQTISICNQAFYHYRQRPNSLNYRQVDDKTMTCLNIPDKIMDYYRYQYPELHKDLLELHVYFLQIMIGRILKPTFVDKKYFKIVTNYARTWFFHSMKCKAITFKMKLYILICTINTGLFWKLYKFIKN